MRETECKRSSFDKTEIDDDNTDTDISLFEESLSMINCDDPLHIDTKRYTHKLINSQSIFSNDVYVKASCNKSINVLVEDTPITFDQDGIEDQYNENNTNTGLSEHVSVASMVEIITKQVIDFDSIDDDMAIVDVSESEYTVECDNGILNRYIIEGNLDEKQAMAFVAICSTFMID